MTAVERSAALRRMGITEWLPRPDDAAAALLSESFVADSPVSAVEKSELVSAPIAPSHAPAVQQAPAEPPIKHHASQPSTSQSTPLVTETRPIATTGVATLRGRLLRNHEGAPLLVLAQIEKHARDGLLHPDTAQGALLSAMLAQLQAPASVAVLGVERGEPIAVPATILVLGERSARLLLGNEVAMPLRGRVHLFGQSRVVVSYHPDELRQNGSLKRLAWDDLRLVAGLLVSASAGPS